MYSQKPQRHFELPDAATEILAALWIKSFGPLC